MAKTQADTLRSEIKELELQLQRASMHKDAFAQMDLYRELDIKKSILININ